MLRASALEERLVYRESHYGRPSWTFHGDGAFLHFAGRSRKSVEVFRWEGRLSKGESRMAKTYQSRLLGFGFCGSGIAFVSPVSRKNSCAKKAHSSGANEVGVARKRAARNSDRLEGSDRIRSFAGANGAGKKAGRAIDS